MAEANEESIKTKILEVFGSDIKVDDLVWEIFPDYFKFKLQHLRVVSGCIETSDGGNTIHFSFYVIDNIDISDLSNICSVFDALLRTSSSNWNPCSYSVETIAQVYQEKPLIKYKLTAENFTTEHLAEKNIVHFKAF